jgi:tetratricopeptide (TPR) repeat protein
LEEQNDKEQAVAQYETAIRYGFDRDPEIYSRLASLYNAAGRTGDAVSLLRTGMRIFPTNPELYRLYVEIRGGD